MASNRLWTAEEDERLAVMVAAGTEYRLIGRALKRSVVACRLRASGRGLKMNRDAILKNRLRGQARFRGNAAKVARRAARIKKSFTPLDRKIRSEECRLRNLSGLMGVRHHSPETKQKIGDANRGRKFTDEHRQKISEARKRYWDLWRGGGISLIAYRRAMAADGPIQYADVAPEDAAKIWCTQCDRQVGANVVAACASRFCKAKALAA